MAAQSGTITAVYSNTKRRVVTILGLTSNSVSPSFAPLGNPAASYTVQGTFGTTVMATAQWQGSNDGGTTWFNVGDALSGAQAASLIVEGNLFGLYQLLISGGDSGTSINAYIHFYNVAD
jgi:hypothetical protein